MVTLLRTGLQLVMRVVGVLFVLGLHLVEPFWKLRFAQVTNSRIGESIGELDIFLKRIHIDGPPARTRIYLIYDVKTANTAVDRIYARYIKRHHDQDIRIIDRPNLVRFFFVVWPVLLRSRFKLDIEFRHFNYFYFQKPIDILTFDQNEEYEGRKALEKMGLGPDDWFMCFHARSAHYLNSQNPSVDWSNRNFRDCQVSNYLAAARSVAARGGYAMRMGTEVDPPLGDTGNSRIIDYATQHRSPFLDIYLATRCKFLIGSTSGIAVAPLATRTPVALANVIPFAWGYLTGQYFIPKHLRQRENGALLNIEQQVALGLYDIEAAPKQGHFYERNGLEGIENSPEEILDLCEDMIDLVEGVPCSDASAELVEEFRVRFPISDSNFPDFPVVSPRFLARNPYLMEPQ